MVKKHNTICLCAAAGLITGLNIACAAIADCALSNANPPLCSVQSNTGLTVLARQAADQLQEEDTSTGSEILYRSQTDHPCGHHMQTRCDRIQEVHTRPVLPRVARPPLAARPVPLVFMDPEDGLLLGLV